MYHLSFITLMSCLFVTKFRFIFNYQLLTGRQVARIVEQRSYVNHFYLQLYVTLALL